MFKCILPNSDSSMRYTEAELRKEYDYLMEDDPGFAWSYEDDFDGWLDDEGLVWVGNK